MSRMSGTRLPFHFRHFMHTVAAPYGGEKAYGLPSIVSLFSSNSTMSGLARPIRRTPSRHNADPNAVHSYLVQDLAKFPSGRLSSYHYYGSCG